MNGKNCLLKSKMLVRTSLSFWYFAMLNGFCEHWKRNKMLEIWYYRVNKYFGYDQGLETQLAHPCVSNGNIRDSNSPTQTIKLPTKYIYIYIQGWHTSMMAAWTLGFWNAMATSGLAIILEIASSGVSPIWSANCKIETENTVLPW